MQDHDSAANIAVTKRGLVPCHPPSEEREGFPIRREIGLVSENSEHADFCADT